MRPILVIILAFGFFSASFAQAQIELNPLKWFAEEEEDALINIDVANAAEEAEAAAMLETGKYQLASGSRFSASRTFKSIIRNYPTAPAAAEARFLAAEILILKGRYAKAFEQLQDIVDDQPGYQNFDDVIRTQFDCATALMEGARGRLLWVIPGFKQYGKAIDQFEQIVRNAPYSPYAPLSLMNVALIADKQEEPEIVIDALDRLINYYPQSMLAPDAYYNMAETYANLVKGPEYDQGATRDAISYYEDYLILFPESEYLKEVEANLERTEDLLARSRLNLGDFYYNYRSNNTAALVYYNETVTIAPDSDAAQEAKQRIADIEAGVRPITGANLMRRLIRAD
jgi:outer membrane protein assembly factor BamD